MPHSVANSFNSSVRGTSSLPRNAPARIEFATLDEPINAKIIHAKHVDGLLHGIRQPFGCRWFGLCFGFGDGFHDVLLWSRFRCEAVQFVRNVFVDGFIHRAFPINFGIQVNEVSS